MIWIITAVVGGLGLIGALEEASEKLEFHNKTNKEMELLYLNRHRFTPANCKKIKEWYAKNKSKR